MNKAELVEKMHNMEELSGGTKAATERVVNGIFDLIVSGLKSEGEVSIAGFGTFLVKHRDARKARNPKTGETVNVPATKVPKFKAAKALKETVK